MGGMSFQGRTTSIIVIPRSSSFRNPSRKRLLCGGIPFPSLHSSFLDPRHCQNLFLIVDQGRNHVSIIELPVLSPNTYEGPVDGDTNGMTLILLHWKADQPYSVKYHTHRSISSREFGLW